MIEASVTEDKLIFALVCLVFLYWSQNKTRNANKLDRPQKLRYD